MLTKGRTAIETLVCSAGPTPPIGPAAELILRGAGIRLSGQHQPIAALRRGLQQRPRIVLQRSADLMDTLHEAVVGDGSFGPDRLHQLVLRDELTGVLGEIAQHSECLRPQDDRMT